MDRQLLRQKNRAKQKRKNKKTENINEAGAVARECDAPFHCVIECRFLVIQGMQKD